MSASQGGDAGCGREARRGVILSPLKASRDLNRKKLEGAEDGVTSGLPGKEMKMGPSGQSLEDGSL